MMERRIQAKWLGWEWMALFASVDATNKTGDHEGVLGLKRPQKHLTAMGLVLLEV